ncbi:N-acetylmuramic acid 6-phosphate etherase [Acidisarcina polymorpha]|uniref:N-acetylmuramic acid 6-phosphate etherase n=1 Tax=Acidisarcina polymorpha TaxID=2211140 RepID=A0A2Z5G676_9BACT|nr:N-acetylmuramic acid 6-phosphate etherase [Acidisarcina polymorpha]AXC14287.1 N-acetylmuramic acid 6-phosphate etherase [Acidisarcina polymorpha]
MAIGTTQERLASGKGTTALGELATEARNPASAKLDELPTLDMLRVINAADREVAEAVAAELPNIATAVDAIVARIRRRGRLFYLGAGTSGRLGVLDASECPPTFGVPGELVQGIIAGGDVALRTSVEGAEDDRLLGTADLKAAGFSARDALVGIAASGRTPYMLGAIDYARALGALTIGLSCVPKSAVASAAEIAITPATGAEILTGSTRMKAGTATKLVLNMLSTAVMVRTGHVYGNWMVNVQMTNAKLVDRAERILSAMTGLQKDDAERLLQKAGSVKCAVLMHKLKIERSQAEGRLAAADGDLRKALGE